MSLIQAIKSEIDDANIWTKDLTLSRNEFLQVKGSKDTNLYYIVNGSLRIFVVDGVEEHTIRFGYRENIITALDTYLTGRPSELYIQAIKKTVLKVTTKELFTKLIQSGPDNLQLWQQVVEGLMFQQMEREMDILTSSPVERYNRVQKRSPQLFQEIPNKYIASYLRMTPETLSRIKKS
ncbi:MAG: Crp/Fnr family transcriptional regulator [Cyclobacteriaceae bacterium]